MQAYKLFKRAPDDADHDLETYGGFPWTFGEWYEADGQGPLCGPGWLHSYDHPVKAELYDPIHGQYGADGVLYRVDVDGETRSDDCGCKQGHTRVRVRADQRVERRPLTIEQRTEIAIRAAAAANGITL